MQGNIQKETEKMYLLKQSQNKKGQKKYLQLAAEKKTPFLVQLEQFFGPSYFVKALVSGRYFYTILGPSQNILTLFHEIFKF